MENGKHSRNTCEIEIACLNLLMWEDDGKETVNGDSQISEREREQKDDMLRYL